MRSKARKYKKYRSIRVRMSAKHQPLQLYNRPCKVQFFYQPTPYLSRQPRTAPRTSSARTRAFFKRSQVQRFVPLKWITKRCQISRMWHRLKNVLQAQRRRRSKFWRQLPLFCQSRRSTASLLPQSQGRPQRKREWRALWFPAQRLILTKLRRPISLPISNKMEKLSTKRAIQKRL